MSMESRSTKSRRRKPPDVFPHLLTRALWILVIRLRGKRRCSQHSQEHSPKKYAFACHGFSPPVGIKFQILSGSGQHAFLAPPHPAWTRPVPPPRHALPYILPQPPVLVRITPARATTAAAYFRPGFDVEVHLAFVVKLSQSGDTVMCEAQQSVDDDLDCKVMRFFHGATLPALGQHTESCLRSLVENPQQGPRGAGRAALPLLPVTDRFVRHVDTPRELNLR